MKKCFKIVILFIITLLVSSTCFAGTPVSKGDATMVLVEDNANTMTFGKYGEFEKKMVEINTQNKTIDIRLTVKNNQEIQDDKDGEVVLLIDSSASMKENEVTINGVTKTRAELVIDSAKQLIEKITKTKKNMKIGVVGFSTSKDTQKEGTEEDAIIYTDNLTGDSATLNEAIDKLSKEETGARTNIQVGLMKADELLETSTNPNANKYIVVLTDAVPNTALNVTSDYYTELSADPSKKELTDLKDKGINIISMLIDISDDPIRVDGRPEDAKFKTYKDVAKYVFGTSLDPTAGRVYYIDDMEIVDTVTKDIYQDLIPGERYALTDIVIKDYFPQNIIDNFDFAILTPPDKGNVTATVNRSDNSITWTISELLPGEVASFSYRLSLKNTFSSDIVGLNLPTNQDVTIDYNENGNPGPEKHNDKAPVVALDVPSSKKIPQTGSNTPIIAGSLTAVAVVIAVVSFISFKKNK